MKNPISHKNLFLVEGLLKSFFHALEYKGLVSITQIFKQYLKAPIEQDDKELLKILLKELYEIHKIDSKNREDKVYIAEAFEIKKVLDHIKILPLVFFDSLMVSRKRFLNQIKLDVSQSDIPHYHQRNFHFQSNGYFSKRSALVYDHQVEILFNGTAQVMRRLLIEKIKLAKKFERPIKILEIGGGTGNMIETMIKSFEVKEYVFSEPSLEYLKLAQENNSFENLQFINSYVENLDLNQERFDLVFSIYLFHELPEEVRNIAIEKMKCLLKEDGIIAIADSIQLSDKPEIDIVLKSFSKDYHEPYYNNYLKWSFENTLSNMNLNLISKSHQLLTKYWIISKGTQT